MPNTFVAIMQNRLLFVFWNVATKIGMRRLGCLLRGCYPSSRCYADSLFFVTPPPPPPAVMMSSPVTPGETSRNNEQTSTSSCSIHKAASSQKGYIALTIDDGLCRQSPVEDHSMVLEVCDLLKKHDDSKATFFVCTDYTTRPQEVHLLLQHGHELGNHLREDVSGYYCNLSKEDFRRELLETNSFLERTASLSAMKNGETAERSPPRPPPKIKWFRAPQGRMSVAMRQVLAEEGLISVMGDCYCDDWFFTQAVDGKGEDGQDDPSEDCRRRKQQTVRGVATLMLRQVQPGSIAIFHMPERGFRESMPAALEAFLRGCRERNLHCVTLSELMRMYNNDPPHEAK